MTRFEPHGNPRTSLRGSILEVRPDGPGNVEGVRRLLDDMAETTKLNCKGPWTVLLVAEAETLLTPEAEQLLTESMPQLTDMGHIATAAAVINTSIRGILEKQLRRIHAKAETPFAAFGTVAEAESWLNQTLSANGGKRTQ